jgi:hypothetical protein
VYAGTQDCIALLILGLWALFRCPELMEEFRLCTFLALLVWSSAYYYRHTIVHLYYMLRLLAVAQFISLVIQTVVITYKLIFVIPMDHRNVIMVFFYWVIRLRVTVLMCQLELDVFDQVAPHPLAV